MSCLTYISLAHLKLAALRWPAGSASTQTCSSRPLKSPPIGHRTSPRCADTTASRHGRTTKLYTGPDAATARRLVDASTVYLYSETAAKDIITAAPHALFIVALRDPVDLVVSYHRSQLVVLSEDEPDFAVAWSRSLRAELPSTGRLLDSKLVDYQMIGRLGAAVSACWPWCHGSACTSSVLRSLPTIPTGCGRA